MANFSNGGEFIYFREYGAQELIQKCADFQWHANIQNQNKHERTVNGHKSSFLQLRVSMIGQITKVDRSEIRAVLVGFDF